MKSTKYQLDLRKNTCLIRIACSPEILYRASYYIPKMREQRGFWALFSDVNINGQSTTRLFRDSKVNFLKRFSVPSNHWTRSSIHLYAEANLLKMCGLLAGTEHGRISTSIFSTKIYVVLPRTQPQAFYLYSIGLSCVQFVLWLHKTNAILPLFSLECFEPEPA